MQHKLKPEFKAAWLAALRSGEYSQTKFGLRNNEGFCCLGVACDVALKIGLVDGQWINDDLKYQKFKFRDSHRDMGEPSYVPMKVCETIFETNVSRESLVSVWTINEKETLPGLNDSGLTFAEIADIIEREY